MKHHFAFAVIAALVAIPASSSAQDMPAEGSTIKGSLAIGRSTFALPPGDWNVVAVGSGHVNIDGSRAGASAAASVRLVQLAAGSSRYAIAKTVCTATISM